MDQIRFVGIQRPTSRIGLGCGRLVGGVSARTSRAVVEAALEAGIAHFDVAPSYGLGLAEDVLGEVLRGNQSVTIATKVGIARPFSGGAMAIVRAVLRPVAAGAPRLKRLMLRGLTKVSSGNHFDVSSVEASLAESLRRLRRTKIDFILLHEPTRSAVTPELVKLFATMVGSGQIGAYGSGTDKSGCDLIEFGSIWQYQASLTHKAGPQNVNHILHGVLRHNLCRVPDAVAQRVDLSHQLGFDLKDKASLPGLFLTAAMARQPDALILISSNDPARIKSNVSSVDWDAANNRRKGFLQAFEEFQAVCRKYQ